MRASEKIFFLNTYLHTSKKTPTNCASFTIIYKTHIFTGKDNCLSYERPNSYKCQGT